MEQIFIGSNISFASIRDYIFEHKVNPGDSIALNPMNYEHLLDYIRQAQAETFELPLNIFGVLLIKDTTGSVEVGKIQIIKNETLQE
ncbi:MAG: hypothetical protein EOO51_00560 [Flavobacterium sp.]|nr:MAG: hypothetical protein EOO51_00560 [Flavobacterium sp.]